MKKPKLNIGFIDGPDGNAFAILGKASKVAKDNGLDWPTIQAEATSGDYDHLLETLKEHFQVEVAVGVLTKPL